MIRVYVDNTCLGCRRALELVAELRSTHPHLDVSAVDVNREAGVPDSIFALPTWCVNARIWMLGNPSWQELQELIDGGTV